MNVIEWVKQNKLKAAIYGAVALLVFVGGKFVVDKTKPKGIRNNNPGNIRMTSNLWDGEVPKAKNSDGAFKQFYSYTDGIAALIRNIDIYFTSRNLRTVRAIISRWAPPTENNTLAYIQTVSDSMGVKPDTILKPSYTVMKGLTAAIIKHENGYAKLSDTDFYNAWSKTSKYRKSFK